MKSSIVFLLTLTLLVLVASTALAGGPAVCVQDAPTGLYCRLDACNGMYCSWGSVEGAGKYSLTLDAACVVGSEETEYVATFNTADYGTAPDDTALCLNKDTVGEALGLSNWQGVTNFIRTCSGDASVTVKVKGMALPKNGNCRQNSPQAVFVFDNASILNVGVRLFPIH